MSERERWDLLRALAPEAVAAGEDFTASMDRLVGEAGHGTLDAFAALAEQASRVTEADWDAEWQRIRRNRDAITAHLTETLLPSDMRAAWIRFDWAEER